MAGVVGRRTMRTESSRIVAVAAGRGAGGRGVLALAGFPQGLKYPGGARATEERGD